MSCQVVPILTQSENWALYGDRIDTSIPDVPILTQSENWALYEYEFGVHPRYLVPILTQSENWAL